MATLLKKYYRVLLDGVMNVNYLLCCSLLSTCDNQKDGYVNRWCLVPFMSAV